MRTGTLFDSPKYKKFIQERDQALEQMHTHAQVDLSRIIHDLLSEIESCVALLALRNQSHRILELHALSHQLETRSLDIFTQFITPVVRRIERLRQASFTLAHLGELEAIGQATKRAKAMNAFDFKQKLFKQTQKSTLLGDSLAERVWLSFMNLRSGICDAFRLALIQKKTPQEVLKSVRAQFPKLQIYKRPPRVLKPLRESDTDPKKKYEISPDFIDEGDWKLAVDAYKDTEISPSRFDQQAEYDPETSTMTYNWELEQNLTDDFVQQVRDGQIDAAKELGIQDFVWIAIIDEKTCKVCCLPRNGKTTSEIEELLASGKLDASECDATTPPAHPFCRCQIGPVASVDEVEGPNWKTFNDWLAA